MLRHEARFAASVRIEFIAGARLQERRLAVAVPGASARLSPPLSAAGSYSPRRAARGVWSASAAMRLPSAGAAWGFLSQNAAQGVMFRDVARDF